MGTRIHIGQYTDFDSVFREFLEEVALPDPAKYARTDDYDQQLRASHKVSTASVTMLELRSLHSTARPSAGRF
jgi:hypothetical protein